MVATTNELKVTPRPSEARTLHPETCPRCGGLMVVEHGFDPPDAAAHPRDWTRRCVQCGEVIDPVILCNRRMPPPVVVQAAAKERGISHAENFF